MTASADPIRATATTTALDEVELADAVRIHRVSDAVPRIALLGVIAVIPCSANVVTQIASAGWEK